MEFRKKNFKVGLLDADIFVETEVGQFEEQCSKINRVSYKSYKDGIGQYTVAAHRVLESDPNKIAVVIFLNNPSMKFLVAALTGVAVAVYGCAFGTLNSVQYVSNLAGLLYEEITKEE